MQARPVFAEVLEQAVLQLQLLGVLGERASERPSKTANHRLVGAADRPELDDEIAAERNCGV